jgi:hypothetical protein
MLGASILMRLTKYTSDPRLEEAARTSLAYSMRCQHGDGSWYYAETRSQRWIDSFHTGFNLEALRYVINAGYGSRYESAYRRGRDYYAGEFFLEDGTPKYYHDKIYPIDIHCPAEAVAFFSGLQPQYQELTHRILRWMLTNMWGGKGYFYFQKRRFCTHRISYMRWSQAWAFHALTEYLFHSQRKGQRDGRQMQAKSKVWAQHEAVGEPVGLSIGFGDDE